MIKLYILRYIDDSLWYSKHVYISVHFKMHVKENLFENDYTFMQKQYINIRTKKGAY